MLSQLIWKHVNTAPSTSLALFLGYTLMQAVEKLEKQVTNKNNAMAEKNTSHKRKACATRGS